MDAYLFIDFGSTFTKLTLVDIEKEEIIATEKSYTTVETDVVIGYENTNFISNTKFDADFDEAMAKVCVDISMNRHAGKIKNIYYRLWGY